MARLRRLVGFDDPLQVVRGFMAVVRRATALLRGRVRGTVAAFDADAGKRVVRQSFLGTGSMDGPAGDGRASGSFLFFRACFPRAPLADVFRCNVCDPDASAIMVEGWMNRGRGRVADGGSVRLGVGIQSRKWRRRHAEGILVHGIHFLRYIRRILGHWAGREGLGI